MTVLLISADQTRSSELKAILQEIGYPILGAENLEVVWQLFPKSNPELLILEALGDEQGELLSLCEVIRANPIAYRIPLLVLSSQANNKDVIAQFLDAGADDVITEPIEKRELAARIRALLRWVNKKSYSPKPNVQLYQGKHLVMVDHEREVWLTPIEFKLIRFLCENQDRYFSAEELLAHVWNYPTQEGDTALVRNHIRNLRRKLELDPDRPTILVSRYGQGYTVDALVNQF